jgi:EAL domain-containing protein (putative c-di-GMP-specific phosphodiesterase class I)/CheY-like chemotaxis protein
VGSVSLANGIADGGDAVRVLVVDDDADVRQTMVRILSTLHHKVSVANDGAQALRILEHEPIDLVITDLSMPNLDGMGMLRHLRECQQELPVLLIAGAPTLESALSAVRYRASEYLVKPLEPETFVAAVQRALRSRPQLRQPSDLERSLAYVQQAAFNETRDLTARFDKALAAIFLVYQPIVSWSGRKAFGYEALVRSGEPSMPHPGALFEAAERLSRTADLGRDIRARCGVPMVDADSDVTLFVNLHSRDLLDETLYDPNAPLAAWSRRCVLELTERAAIDGIEDISDRINRLRELGYRIAVDDIGAGYSGLNSFATVQPDFVKLDITLVRGLHRDGVRRRLVRLLAELCRDLGIYVVAEGVETCDERDALIELGIDLLQGFLFARPAAPFVRPQF